LHLEFEKWHGCKNDFLVTWIQATDKDIVVPSLQRQATQICDRNGSGVAADGILVLITKNHRELFPEELVVINSDGSLAKNCGNGLRCAARSVLRKMDSAGMQPADLPPALELRIQGRPFWCKVFGPKGFIGIDMGSATIESIGPQHLIRKELNDALEKFQIKQPTAIYKVDVGNPHLVLLGIAPDKGSFSAFANQIQNLDGWDGINVHAATEEASDDRIVKSAAKAMNISVDPIWTALPWERGVGLTQACGSGAVAIAAAISAADDMGENSTWTAIKMPGGDLFVQIVDGNHILAGPATLVFTGSLEI
jgi:diaminopimelate epimerase